MNWTIKWLYSLKYRYVRINLSGTFCLADMKSAGSDIAEQSLWSHGDSILLDATFMDMGDIGSADIVTMSGMMEQLDNKVGIHKVAVVGCSNLQFGLARMFQMKTESYTTAEIRAFRYAPAAIDWLTTESSSFDLSEIVPTPDFNALYLGSPIRL